MKQIICLLFLLLLSSKGFAQEKQNMTEANSSQTASYPGGDQAFADDFLKMVYAYTDIHQYSVNGKFFFVFDVTKKEGFPILMFYLK